MKQYNIYALILGILLLGISYSLGTNEHLNIRGSYVDLRIIGPYMARIFLTISLVFLIYSFYPISVNQKYICPSCECVLFSTLQQPNCPTCNIPLEPLKGYYERKSTAEDKPLKTSLPVRQASSEPPRKALDGLTLTQAIPVAGQATPAWAPALLALPFALVLHHYTTMTLQTFIALGLCFAFFLWREIHRGAMLSNPADMAPWRRRLATVMLLMIAATALNVTVLDRIGLS